MNWIGVVIWLVVGIAIGAFYEHIRMINKIATRAPIVIKDRVYRARRSGDPDEYDYRNN